MLFFPQNRSVYLAHQSAQTLTRTVSLSLSHPQVSWSFPYRIATLENPWRSLKPYPSRQYRVLTENLRSVRPGKPSRTLVTQCGLNVLLRFHPSDENILYTISNTTAVRAKGRSKVTPRHAYISKWDCSSWKVTKSRKVSDKGVTCFDMRREIRIYMPGSRK